MFWGLDNTLNVKPNAFHMVPLWGSIASIIVPSFQMGPRNRRWLVQGHMTSILENWHLISFCQQQVQCSIHTISLPKINDSIFTIAFCKMETALLFLLTIQIIHMHCINNYTDLKLDRCKEKEYRKITSSNQPERPMFN